MLVNAADRIGLRLLDAAVREGEACTWEVVTSHHKANDRRAWRRVIAGGTVYQGTSGIALFLAELARVTGSDRYRSAAMGALRYAALRGRPMARLGLYAGEAGTALVASRLAKLFASAECVSIGRACLDGLRSAIAHDVKFDVIAGAAGTIVALLALDEAIGGADRLEIAIAAGEHLAAKATRRVHGWSWATMTAGTHDDLCGYAHGASGVAHAFLELFAATGDAQWRFAAERAMDFERAHAIAETGDWPDFREGEVFDLVQRGRIDDLRALFCNGGVSVAHRPRITRAWCHGGPGIALVRLRAMELGVAAELCERELSAVIATVVADVKEPASRNYSLCHGFFGNAEPAVVTAWHRGYDLAAPIHQAILSAVSAHESGKPAWPCGTLGARVDPSLMVGEAGIGHFLLRLADPSIPPILCVSAERKVTVIARPAAAEDDAARVCAEALHLMPMTASVLLSDAAIRKAAPRPDTLAARGSVLALVENTLAFFSQCQDDVLAGASEIDALVLAEIAAYDDYLPEYCRRLLRPAESVARRASTRFRLAVGARIVCTADAWTLHAGQEIRRLAGGRGCLVIYRSGRTVTLDDVAGPTAAVLSALSEPLCVEEVVDRVAQWIEIGSHERDGWVRFVQNTIMSAVAVGLVDTETGQSRNQSINSPGNLE